MQQGGSGPVHLLVDSTGLRLCGPGEWLTEKHGTKRRRAWRVLHLATDADTGRIVASVLTDKDADDGSQVTLLHVYANSLKGPDISESVNLHKCLILLDSCRIHATR